MTIKDIILAEVFLLVRNENNAYFNALKVIYGMGTEIACVGKKAQ